MFSITQLKERYAIEDIIYATSLGLLSSSCCAIQLILNTLSISCAGFSVLSPYRTFFLSMTTAFLGYQVSREGLSTKTCISIGLATSLAISPEIVSAWNQNTFKRYRPKNYSQHFSLKILNVACEACTHSIKSRLLEIPGVTEDTLIVFQSKEDPVYAEVYIKGKILTNEDIIHPIEEINDEFKVIVIQLETRE